MTETERRKSERFSLELPASLSVIDESDAGIRFEAVTRNICSGGAFLLTSRPVPAGSDIRISLVLLMKKNDPVKGKKTRIDVSGRVIRADPHGIAVCFGSKYSIRPVKGESLAENFDCKRKMH